MKDIEEAAKQCAGNHNRFDSFGWHDKPEDDQDYFIYNTSNRDSGLREKSNESVFHKELLKFENDVHTESHNHWAVGYVDCLIIRVYREGSITEAFKKWHELACCLEEFPVLSEEAYSDLLLDATIENIISERPRGVDLPDEWEKHVYHYLYDNDPRSLDDHDDQGGWPGREKICEALTALDIKWEEDDD